MVQRRAPSESRALESALRRNREAEARGHFTKSGESRLCVPLIADLSDLANRQCIALVVDFYLNTITIS